jgi:uncharacterized membrane protein YeaQ/YmgE (transglycosylase-associated protein family)
LEGFVFNFVLWVVIGGGLGALATWRGTGHTLAGLIVNLLAGVVGAYLTALLLTPVLAASSLAVGHVSGPALLLAAAGAVGLLGVINLGRHPAPLRLPTDD